MWVQSCTRSGLMIFAAAVLSTLAGAAPAAGDVGGDDISIRTGGYVGSNSLDVDAAGYLYAAYEIDGPYGRSIQIDRSTDKGTTWAYWGAVIDADPNVDLVNPVLVVGEGIVDRCYVAYVSTEAGADRSEIRVSKAALGSFPAFTTVTVLSQAGLYPDYVDLASDDASFADYYLYLVADVDDDAGVDVWFSRSTDQSATFENPYAITPLATTDTEYLHPKVCYGFGGYIHVTWYVRSNLSLFDDAVRYRRAPGYASGGLQAWDSVRALTSTGNGVDEMHSVVSASTAGSEVVVAYVIHDPLLNDVGIAASTDAGATFPFVGTTGGAMSTPQDLAYATLTDQFILLESNVQVGFPFKTGYCLRRTAASDPLVWEDQAFFTDVRHGCEEPLARFSSIALDPTHADRAAVLWTSSNAADTDTLLFDAEWRGDPGYPNVEDGFPVDLPDGATNGHPLLVDLDGDGTLEILFTDGANIYAYDHDGTPVAGWPATDGGVLQLATSIAAGELNHPGDPVVVMATNQGRVYAFSSGGDLLGGWPYDMPVAATTQVSIGAVGVSNPRSIIATGGSHVRILNSAGEHVPGVWGWSVPGETTGFPHAVGDIDGDGVSEIVVPFNWSVYAFDRADASATRIALLDTLANGGVSLADMDLDGDVEILVATRDSYLHLFRADGSEPAGWPWFSGGGFLRRPVVADVLGDAHPEIALTDASGTVFLLDVSGTTLPGYPVTSGESEPIIDMVGDAVDPDVICRTSSQIWAWNETGTLLDGWPKAMSDFSMYGSPASGDIDLDGSLEIVLLGATQLMAVDVNQTPGAGSRSWSQFGHDARRSGCSDCPEYTVTGVGDNTPGVTRVSFAGASPNPLRSDGTVFRFALPVRAVVDLSVYDLRGRLMRRVTREEVTAGSHALVWDGRDNNGRPLASGQYVATLRLRGPGLEENLTRKMTVIR